MSKFYSTHQWANGTIITLQRLSDSLLSLRIQGENEQMLADIEVGEYELLCLAHSILSVITNPSKKENK